MTWRDLLTIIKANLRYHLRREVVMCPACGRSYESRLGHREHNCNAY